MAETPFWTRAALALGLAERAEATAPAPGVMPPARSAASVTVSDALTLDAVFRAFFVLQTAVEQLTLDVWDRGTRLAREAAPRLVTKPDPDQHLATWLAETVGDLAGHGNAYMRVLRWDDGQPIALRGLPAADCHPWRDRHGVAWVNHDGKDLRIGTEVAHLRLLKLRAAGGRGQLLGLGPIQAAQVGLRGQLSQATYANGWFDTATVPNGVLSSDQHLTPTEAQTYKQQWQQSQRFGEGPAVLGKGLDYRPLVLKPADVQWLETQKFGVTGTARLFGMPSRYLLAPLDGTTETYANQEQEDIAFVRYTLMRYLREIETLFEQLLPRTRSVRFNVDALLRTDTRTRYEAHRIGLEAKFLTVPEVRAIEGLPPLTEAELAQLAAKPTTDPDPAEVTP